MAETGGTPGAGAAAGIVCAVAGLIVAGPVCRLASLYVVVPATTRGAFLLAALARANAEIVVVIFGGLWIAFEILALSAMFVFELIAAQFAAIFGLFTT